jgi:hypothetical protein
MAQPMTNKKRVSLAKKYIEQVDRVDLEEEEEHDDDLDVLSDHDNLIVQDDHARSNVMGTAYGTSSMHIISLIAMLSTIKNYEPHTA